MGDYSLGSIKRTLGRTLDWRKTIINLDDHTVKGACVSSFVRYLNTDNHDRYWLRSISQVAYKLGGRYGNS